MSHLGSSQDAAVITAAIIDLAHRLGLKVVDEGGDAEAQLDCLRVQGCDEIQGYYFARLRPAREFVVWCRDANPLYVDR